MQQRGKRPHLRGLEAGAQHVHHQDSGCHKDSSFIAVHVRPLYSRSVRRYVRRGDHFGAPPRQCRHIHRRWPCCCEGRWSFEIVVRALGSSSGEASQHTVGVKGAPRDPRDPIKVARRTFPRSPGPCC